MVEEQPEIINVLKKELGDSLLDLNYLAKSKALSILIHKSSITKVIETLKKVSGDEVHLTTISGADLGGNLIELTYFFWLLPQKLRIIVKIKLPKEDLKIQSISEIMPAAMLYEREVYEMFGVTFERHPKLERLFLPEDWPENVYPLRRS